MRVSLPFLFLCAVLVAWPRDDARRMESLMPDTLTTGSTAHLSSDDAECKALKPGGRLFSAHPKDWSTDLVGQATTAMSTTRSLDELRRMEADARKIKANAYALLDVPERAERAQLALDNLEVMEQVLFRAAQYQRYPESIPKR
jgi:hypothetical protein